MNIQTEFKIQQLRTKNLVMAVQSIAVAVGAIIIAMILPQLIVRYILTEESIFQYSAQLEYIPVVAYSFATLYFLYSMFTNFMRERKAAQLEKTLDEECSGCSDEACGCEDGCCDEISEEELAKLEEIVNETVKPAKKSNKKTAKKAKK